MIDMYFLNKKAKLGMKCMWGKVEKTPFVLDKYLSSWRIQKV